MILFLFYWTLIKLHLSCIFGIWCTDWTFSKIRQIGQIGKYHLEKPLLKQVNNLNLYLKNKL